MTHTTENGYIFHLKDPIGYKLIKEYRIKAYDNAPTAGIHSQNYHHLETAVTYFVDKIEKDGKTYTPTELFDVLESDADLVEIVHKVILPLLMGEKTKKK
jgi:hypothetical protein